MPSSRASSSAVSPMFKPQTGSVSPSFRPTRGSKSAGRKAASAASFAAVDFALASVGKFLRGRIVKEQRHVRHAFRAADDEDRAAARGHPLVGGGERFEARGAVAMHGDRRDGLGNAGAQGDDARDIRRLRRAGATQPKMTSSISAGSRPVRVSSASTAMRPSSSAASVARSVPALQNGVRTPSMMTRRHHGHVNARRETRS